MMNDNPNLIPKINQNGETKFMQKTPTQQGQGFYDGDEIQIDSTNKIHATNPTKLRQGFYVCDEIHRVGWRNNIHVADPNIARTGLL